MNTKKIEKLVNAFGLPILTVLAGLILLFNPDGATALVTKLLGWLLVGGGALTLIVPAVGKQPIAASQWVLNGVCIILGVILLANPLILANLIGRALGILILIEGLNNLKAGGSKVLAAVTVVAGLVLLIMPRTLTQTLFVIFGIVLMVIGIVNILGNIRMLKRLDQARDPNIIDADQ